MSVRTTTTKATRAKSKIVTHKGSPPSPATINKVTTAAKWIAKGKSRATVIEDLIKTFDMAEATAVDYYKAALHFLLPDNEDEVRKDIMAANYKRLEEIIERCMENRNYKVAREAIAELNKMAGLGSGVKIAVNNDAENNTQQIYIKFD